MTLSERILKVLGDSPIPVRTPDLVLLCLPPRKRHARQLVWDCLRYLLRSGLVRSDRRRVRGSCGHTVSVWRLA